MKNLPHNPGLSDKAWNNLHALIAEFQIKYGKKLVERKKEVNPDKNEEEHITINKTERSSVQKLRL